MSRCDTFRNQNIEWHWTEGHVRWETLPLYRHTHTPAHRKDISYSRIRSKSSDRGTRGSTCYINVRAEWTASLQLDPLHRIMCCSLVWSTPWARLNHDSRTRPVTLDLRSDLQRIVSAWRAHPIKKKKKNKHPDLFLIRTWLHSHTVTTRHWCVVRLARARITVAAAITKDDSAQRDQQSTAACLP